MPFVGCCALVYFWTLRFSRIGDFYTLRLGFFGNLDLRIIYRFFGLFPIFFYTIPRNAIGHGEGEGQTRSVSLINNEIEGH